MRRPVCLFALLFAAAVWAALLIHPPVERIDERADGRFVTVSGTVEWKEYVQSASETPSLRLTLGKIRIESGLDEAICPAVHRDDKILCTVSAFPAEQEDYAREGARIRVRGKLRLYRRPTNDGEFDAFLYYCQIQGCLFALRDTYILAYTQTSDPLLSALYRARRCLSEAIDHIYQNSGVPSAGGSTAALLTAPYGGTASIMKAMLLGQTSLLDPDLKELYQAAGILHVLCISGVHISLIGSGIFRVLRRFGIPHPLSCAVSAALLFLYGLMTGMHASCVRALIMFGFQSAARALGRTYDTLTALSVAAVLLLIQQPAYLRHSGFLFSFTAVIAIALGSEVISARAVPLLIPICTLPVQLSFYYTFPLYSVLLNLVVIALAPFLIAGGILSLLVYLPAMVLSGGAAAGALRAGSPGAAFSLPALLLSLARLIGKLPSAILRLFDLMARAAERLPFHTLIPGKPALFLIVAYYLLIAAAAAAGIYGKNHKNNSRRSPHALHTYKTAALQLVLTAAAVAMLLTVRFKPPLSMYMLDVGQGDGLCLIGHDESGDSCILIDGGSSSRQMIGKYVEVPFLTYHGISRIDCCVLTHDDLDHCSGLLELLAQHSEADGVRIGSIALPSVAKECRGKLYLEIEETAKKQNIPVLYLHRGMELSQGALHLRCLHPGPNARYEDSNAYSVVLEVRYRDFSALLTGDLEGEGERDMLASLEEPSLRTCILKAAHHGSGGATTQDFLTKVSADAALISCGRDNPYGHPATETIQRLSGAGMKIYDTRINGQIRIMTDGVKGYRIDTYRSGAD